jgi:hypothetical protein
VRFSLPSFLLLSFLSRELEPALMMWTSRGEPTSGKKDDLLERVDACLRRLGLLPANDEMDVDGDGDADSEEEKPKVSKGRKGKKPKVLDDEDEEDY